MNPKAIAAAAGIGALAFWALRRRDAVAAAPDVNLPILPPSTAPTPAFNSTVAIYQQKLWSIGYDPGPTDGVLGTQTRAAIASFQRDHTLPTTGQLDTQTKRAIDGWLDVMQGGLGGDTADGGIFTRPVVVGRARQTPMQRGTRYAPRETSDAFAYRYGAPQGRRY